MGCHFLKGIFQTHGLNLGLSHYRQNLYHLSHQGNIIVQDIDGTYYFNPVTPHGSFNLLTFKVIIDRYVCSVQCSSVTQSSPMLCDPMNCSTAGLRVHHQLPEFTILMSIESVMPSNHLILCHHLLLPPSIFPSIKVFSNESVLRIRWPKFWSCSFSISSSNEHSGLISFRMDWLYLFAVQGNLKNLPQHHTSKASILWRSALFIVQLSHPYMTTGKTIALTRWTFVNKVMSLLFNMFSRLVITFLLRRKHLLISWLQVPSAVILEPKKIKSLTVFPSVYHEVMGPDAMIFVF